MKMAKTIIEKFEVYLRYESSTYGGAVCAGEDPNKRYVCHEPTHTEFTPTGIVLEQPGWSESIQVDFDPSKCDTLYVVIVRYSSGGTFGTSHGHWHVIGAYKTYIQAMKVEKTIPDKYKGDKPWEGYFESFEKVGIERLDVWK